MTTTDPLGGIPQGPSSTGPQQPSVPVYAGAPATVQQQLKKPMGLALAALLVGIGAFLFGLIPIFGALVGIAALVLGIFALRKQQSKGMAIAGIVLGSIAIVSSIGAAVGIGAVVNNTSQNQSPASVSETAEADAEKVTPADPIESAEVPEPEAPTVPVEFKSALTKAESYSEIMHMSKLGIYGQLTSEYGEQFSAEAAQYAVDNVVVDWNANALAKAKSYQETMAMSPEAIRDQLTSEYGEQFTAEEADFAILNLNS